MGDKIIGLRKDIDELRTILNEMSTSLLNDKMMNELEILNTSKRLDELIVKYCSLTKEDLENE